ncbi:molecular chaperone DnaJ [Cohnella kolymensis]|uniref:Molecular chaperone DnaJ n=1 Tax=Cohnella kolymensis TaxID=1590652 RepID=A0ABR5A5H5_9BACL|nr:DnaJ family domain-containing protein [Cohnella kolymensis]KIL36316.1 molecular chaperone DnaJ [Cohnella kolymensis]
MNWARIIAEERIREAQREGAFDNLPGAGKPLPPDDLEGVPEDLRMGYRMLKNAAALPEEMQLRKDMVSLQELLRSCRDDDEKAKLNAEMNAKQLRYRMLMDQRGWNSSDSFIEYESRIQEKLAEPGKDPQK